METNFILKNGKPIIWAVMFTVALFINATDLFSQNIALNKTATASSVEGGYNAGNVSDGSTSTRWASQFNSDNEWIYVDLGATYSITRVVLKWETAYGKSYKVQTSANASTWTDVYSTTTGDGGTDDITLTGSGRYVRMAASQRGTTFAYSLWEFEVYGTAASSKITVEGESYTANNGVFSETCSEGGQNVGAIDANDWMDYSVNIPTTGSYTLEYRTAGYNTANVTMKQNGTQVSSINVSPTGAWQTYTTTSTTVNLTAGTQTIRITTTNGGFNLNWFALTAGGGSTPALVVTARGENAGAGEGIDKLYDNNLNTKWLDASATSWVQFAYNTAQTFSKYDITSGNDAPERDPKNWTLLGSNDGTNWTTLNTQSNQSWTARNQTRSFTFSNSTAYKYYKWNITANQSGSLIQASELKFGTGSSTTYPNDNAALGMNMASFNYFANDWPFVNLARSGQWRDASWGDKPFSSLTSNGYLPVNNSGLFIIFMDNQTFPFGPAATNLVFTYTGTATFSVVGGASVTSQTPGRIVMSVPANYTGQLYFSISNHTSQLGNFRLTEDYNENNTATFRQAFLDQWKYFGWLRFMDWMCTNNSNVVNTSDYPSNNYLAEDKGASFATMVELCNTLHTNAWINIPHKASDAFVTNLATYFKNNLNAGLKVYVEYSNECWNSQFSQFNYCINTGLSQGLDADQWAAWKKFYAKRSAEVHTLFESIYGATSTDIVRLVAWQGFDTGACNEVLGHYQTYKGKKADALATAPYFGGSLDQAYAAQAVTWDVNKLFTHLDPANNSQLTGGENEGNLKQVQAVMNSLGTVATNRGVRLIAYEGGQHLVGVSDGNNDWSNNVTLMNLFISANRDARMKNIYLTYLNYWKAAGGKEFMIFSSCGPFSKHGSWCVKEKYTQTRTEAPKYDACLTWMENNPIWFTKSTTATTDSSSINEVVGIGSKEVPQTVSDINVYPNPASTNLHISNTANSVIFVAIYDIDGRKLYENQSSESLINIDVTNFKEGFYLVNIVSGDQVSTKRVFIRR